jgi:outer membrane protein assembly factor BamB
MFHVKPRWPLLFVLLALAGLGTIACTPGNTARGWAEPVQVENVLLVSTGKGRLDAIDLTTRGPLWRFPNRWQIHDERARGLQGIYATPVLSSDNQAIFVGDYNGYVYAFRPADLEILSEEKPVASSLKLEGGPIIGGIVLDSASDTLYVTAGPRMYALKASDLVRRIDNRDTQVERRELFRAAEDIWSAPVLQSGRLFFASLDGNLYAIDANTGQEAWRYSGTRALVSTPVIAGTRVLIGGFDDELHAIDMADGTNDWSFRASNWVWTAPLVDGSRVYVGDFDGKVYALNLSDGSVVWSQDVSDRPIVAAPALARGTLVVASQGGDIHGIDPSSQAARWEARNIATAVNADLVTNGGTVLIAPSSCVTPPGEAGRVFYMTLDAATGSLTSTDVVC